MAVTQQLARLPPAEIALCRTSVEAVDRLCAFDLRPASDYLDLDWAPRSLERLAEHADLADRQALQLALDGEETVEFPPDWPTSPWEPAVGFLSHERVHSVAPRLQAMGLADATATLPSSTLAACDVLGLEPGWPEHPGDYLRRQAVDLCRFFVNAANRGLGVAMWWD